MTALQRARAAFKTLPKDVQEIASEYYILVQEAMIPKAKAAYLKAANVYRKKFVQIRNSNIGDEKALNLMDKIEGAADMASDVWEDEITKVKKEIKA